jgi:hypothetical protein
VTTSLMNFLQKCVDKEEEQKYDENTLIPHCKPCTNINAHSNIINITRFLKIHQRSIALLDPSRKKRWNRRPINIHISPTHILGIGNSANRTLLLASVRYLAVSRKEEHETRISKDKEEKKKKKKDQKKKKR